MGRRRFVQAALASVAGAPVLMACSPEVTPFKSTDVTGATFAQDFRLKDHLGNLRTLADFKGKITVVFFGFTQCPDVCPTSMTTQSTELKPPVCKPVKDGACIECCAEADFAPSHVESASAPSWLPSHG